MSDRVALARAIAARTKPRFIEIPREKRKPVPFTKEEPAVMRGGLTAEEYRWKLIRETNHPTRVVSPKEKGTDRSHGPSNIAVLN